MGRLAFRSLFLAAALAVTCLAQPFFLRKDFMVEQHPTAIIPGDFNGDARPDLAVATDSGLFVLLNDGSGGFGRPIPAGIPAGLFYMPAAADFNGDGKDDLIGSGSLFLGRGDGTFLAARPIGAQEAVAAADFTGDGKMDVLLDDYLWAASGFHTHGVRILPGNGDGTFGPEIKLTDRAAVQVRIADFNRDGRPDIAVLPVPGAYPDLTSSTSTTLLVFLGKADGTFATEIRTPIPANAAGWWPSAFLVADFNGDKLPDVVAASGVLLGKGDGTFGPPIPYTTDVPAFPITAADFSGDGFADLVMSYDTNSIAICRGKGDGTLLPPVEQSVAHGNSFLNLGIPLDLDGDGRMDLITGNYFYNSITALIAQPQGGPALQRAISAAADIAIVAPESLATLFAASPAVEAIGMLPWPTSLGGISLAVRDSVGATRQAPLLSVSPTQIKFQVPAGTTPGEAVLSIVNAERRTEAGSMFVAPQAPAIFLVAPGSEIPAATALLVAPDGTQTGLPLFDCSSELGCGFLPIPLSTAGAAQIYVSFFGTGFNNAAAGDIICSINGVQVPVLYAGAQLTPGVQQVNVRLIPEILRTPGGGPYYGDLVTVTMRASGLPANSFALWIQ